MRAPSGYVATGLRLVVLYVATAALGFVLFVAGFRIGLFGVLDILFYRGLVLIAVAALGTFAIAGLATRRLAPLALRDAFAATVLSMSLNLSFLVVVPVTVDRSISIFMLGYMASNPEETFTPEAMSAIFVATYVDKGRQIERRLHEQTVSGNVTLAGTNYRISRRGLAVVEIARFTAWLFQTQAGILPTPKRPGSP